MNDFNLQMELVYNFLAKNFIVNGRKFRRCNFAQLLDISPPAVTKYIKGGIDQPSYKALSNMHKYIGLEKNWVTEGKGEMSTHDLAIIQQNIDQVLKYESGDSHGDVDSLTAMVPLYELLKQKDEIIKTKDEMIEILKAQIETQKNEIQVKNALISKLTE